VTAEGCHAWGKKFETIMMDAYAVSTDACAKKVIVAGGSPDEAKATAKRFLASFEHTLEKGTSDLVEGCTTLVGKQTYVLSDADCFVGAKALNDWQTCGFSTDLFEDLRDIGGSYDKSMTAACDKGIKGGGIAP
jgi:hypothetical protein